MKQNLTWENLIRVGGLAAALLTATWQVTSTVVDKLDGVEKRLSEKINTLNLDATERRVEMQELRRRVEALERQLENRR